jgi:hypothetical protein
MREFIQKFLATFLGVAFGILLGAYAIHHCMKEKCPTTQQSSTCICDSCDSSSSFEKRWTTVNPDAEISMERFKDDTSRFYSTHCKICTHLFSRAEGFNIDSLKAYLCLLKKGGDDSVYVYLGDHGDNPVNHNGTTIQERVFSTIFWKSPFSKTNTQKTDGNGNGNGVGSGSVALPYDEGQLYP